ncbi:hypothetical protein [Sinosporangium siamense]|nr:hypothetical protein [Sinosporangium siamense]
MTGSLAMAQRVAEATRGTEKVRPAGRVTRRHWSQTDRAFSIRMSSLVQPAPPYSALYGLVRVGLVSRDWAHRQAGLYPTHIHLKETDRSHALDLRPTVSGWLDLESEHSVQRYLRSDGSPLYGSFTDVSVEPMLSDLFNRIRAYFGMHAPLGQVGAEKGLVRLCWLLAKLEYIFRNEVTNDPVYRMFSDGKPTVEQLYAAADEASVNELVELVRLLHSSGSLNEMRTLAGNPPLGRPWGIARPVFNSYWADHDLLIGGQDGTTLVDVNSVSKTNNSTRSRRWIWRLLCCAWLDSEDAYRIRNVAMYFSRYGSLVTWPVEELALELFEGEDPEDTRHEFLGLVQQLREEDRRARPREA